MPGYSIKKRLDTIIATLKKENIVFTNTVATRV